VEHQELTKRRSRAARKEEQGEQQNKIKQNRASTRTRSRRSRRALDQSMIPTSLFQNFSNKVNKLRTSSNFGSYRQQEKIRGTAVVLSD
jgi:hypothetical protein